LSTPLQAHQIVTAKLAAGLAGLAPMVLLLGGFWLLCELAMGVTPGGLVMNSVAIALVVLLAYTLGAAGSLHARSQRAAFSAGFGIIGGLLFVFPILLLMFQSFSIFYRDRDFVEFIIGATNPSPYLAHVSSPLANPRYHWEGWAEQQRQREEHLWPMFQF